MASVKQHPASRLVAFHPAARLVANCAIALGVGWIALAFLAAINWAVERAPEDTAFISLALSEIGLRVATPLIRVLSLLSPACAAAYVGIRLRLNVTPATVRPSAALLSFMAAMTVVVVPFVFDGFGFEPRAVVRAAGELWTFVLAATAALPIYAVLYRWVLKHDEIRAAGIRGALSQPMLVLSAFLIGWYAFHAMDFVSMLALPSGERWASRRLFVAATIVGVSSYFIAMLRFRRNVTNTTNRIG